ncbi:hypothetical protein FA95DRAFT_1612761 [Auriscalpium vulgare]|uniref:Uncharacterized protein n=1 Tax=Auriscalpium vulgare TaxID=40419 RepID=A0ACB8R6D7_9AGAM|nr:hypothetical protein FA95DRAFT_1612761 [Auriscalpium vulgare]
MLISCLIYWHSPSFSTDWFGSGGALDSQTSETQWYDSHFGCTESQTDTAAHDTEVRDSLNAEEPTEAALTSQSPGQGTRSDGEGKETNEAISNDSGAHSGSQIAGSRYLSGHARQELIADQRQAYQWLRPWARNATPADSVFLAAPPWAVRPDSAGYAEWDHLDDCLKRELSVIRGQAISDSSMPMVSFLQPWEASILEAHGSTSTAHVEDFTLKYLAEVERRAKTFYIATPIMYEEFKALHARMQCTLSHVLMAYMASDLALVEELLDVADAAHTGMRALVQHERKARAVVATSLLGDTSRSD